MGVGIQSQPLKGCRIGVVRPDPAGVEVFTDLTGGLEDPHGVGLTIDGVGLGSHFQILSSPRRAYSRLDSSVRHSVTFVNENLGRVFYTVETEHMETEQGRTF